MLSVIKLGGSTLDGGVRPEMLAPLAAWVCAGERLVIVHGGGKTLTSLLATLGAGTQFRQGLRVTDPPTLEAAVMALAGSVNTRLVAALNQVLAGRRAPPRAVGLTGLDGGSLQARRLDPELGRVGETQPADPRLLQCLLAADYIPVLASLAPETGAPGEILNVNADIFASSCAALLAADRLLFVTDVPGVLDRGGRRLDVVRLAELEALQQSGQVSGGMLPKLQACRQALAAGVAQVAILGAAALPPRLDAEYPHTRILASARESRV